MDEGFLFGLFFLVFLHHFLFVLPLPFSTILLYLRVTLVMGVGGQMVNTGKKHKRNNGLSLCLMQRVLHT